MLLIIHTGTSNKTQISNTLKSSHNKVTFNVINFFHSMSFSFIWIKVFIQSMIFFLPSANICSKLSFLQCELSVFEAPYTISTYPTVHICCYKLIVYFKFENTRIVLCSELSCVLIKRWRDVTRKLNQATDARLCPDQCFVWALTLPVRYFCFDSKFLKD